MSAALVQAVDQLTQVTDAVLVELRAARADRDRARRDTPDYQAFLAARRDPARKVTFATFLRAIPGMAELFAISVPGSFWAQTASDVVEVSCPCGATPTCRYSVAQACDCGRWFLYDGRDVRVAFSPKETA